MKHNKEESSSITTIQLDNERSEVTVINADGQAFTSPLRKHYAKVLDLVDGIWANPSTRQART